MKPSVLGVACAALSLALLPSAVWAQHGGHGHHGHSHAASIPSHGHFHAPPYYLLRRHDYPYEYFAPGGYLDPYAALRYWLTIDPYPWPVLPHVDLWSTPGNPYSASALTAAPGSPIISPVQEARARVSTGEVRLHITPGTAAAFLDGAYVGAAKDYSGSTMLALEAGHHHFELRANGYQTLAFDVEAPAGRKIVVEKILLPVPRLE